MSHKPVMLTEVLEYLHPVSGGVYVDGTFGAGGYTGAILDAADCRVIAIDRDPSAQARVEVMRDQYGDRLAFVHGNFADIENILKAQGQDRVDGFVLDIGVSSMQIDQAERGFSFLRDGPLDMRMDTSKGKTAADLVNDTDEADLANIIYRYGEERHSRRIARAIVSARSDGAITHTLQLADIVEGAVPKSRNVRKGGDIHPATRTFQALRIAVNDELGALESALDAGKRILNPDGRMVVVSFHSLEDRIVKTVFKEASDRASRGSRYMPEVVDVEAPVFKLLTTKAVRPSDGEVVENPRARSARLRAVESFSDDMGGGQ